MWNVSFSFIHQSHDDDTAAALANRAMVFGSSANTAPAMNLDEGNAGSGVRVPYNPMTKFENSEPSRKWRIQIPLTRRLRYD